MARKLKKCGKWDTHTVGPVIGQENWQRRKMKNTHDRIWNMARNFEKGEKWEMFTVGPRIWLENWGNVENERHTF